MVFSHAYRLRRADVNGASVEYRFVSRAVSALFLLRLAFAIVRPVIGDIRPAPRIAGRGGRAGRFCLLAAVGSFGPVSFLSSACSFLAHRHLLGREHSPAVSSCLLCLVRAVYRSALRRGRSSPFLVRRHVGCLFLLRRRRVSYRPRPVPRAVPLPALLLFVIRPVLRHGGRGDVLRGFSDVFVACAVACRAWGGAACPHGVLSSWVVLAVVRVMCVVCMRRLLAVLVVYWYCQLVVYIVRLDF